MGRPALALLALLAIFSGADAKKTKKLSAAEREERRAKGELLMNAVNLGDREEVERLIEEEDAGKCVNHDAGGGKGAPLRNAAKMGYTRIVDILLQAGADIDQPNTVGVTPLYYAAMNGRIDTMRLLIRRGAFFPKEPTFEIACFPS